MKEVVKIAKKYVSVDEILGIAKARDYYFMLKSDLMKCKKYEMPEQKVMIDEHEVDTELYDREEIHPNCTVQVWTNSYTGKTSVGWWPNERESF